MPAILGAIAAGLHRKSEAVTRYGALEQLWHDLFVGPPAKSGVSVNWTTALQVTTVLACTRRIAEALMVPCKVYRRDPVTRSREEARDHPLYDLLAVQPNGWQSGLEFRETLAFHAVLAGNAYSYIGRVGGSIDELIPLDPACVTVNRSPDNVFSYTVRLADGQQTFPAEDIWHVRGPSWDAAVGLNAVRLAREAIGLALASEETHARLYSNGAQPGGILTTDKELGKEARQRLKAQWTETQVGLANKFRTAVLDSGLKWQPLAMTGVDAQHVQVRQLQVEEICRAMGVMPIMVGYSGDKAPTYASAEQLFLAHLVHTVRPWHDRVAASADRWLLTREERRAGYYVGFVDAAFLSPAMKDKAEYNKIALGGGGNPGWLTPNEVRGFDEMPAAPGGDRLYVPTNTTPIGDDGLPLPPRPAPASDGGQGGPA
ncbi:MAG: phage portal protein [Reyranellaceae bacterium]